MKHSTCLALLIGLACGLSGCSKPDVVDVPNPDRMPRKDFKQMSVDDKIKFINHTPMSADAKQKEIDRIKRGLD